MKLKTHRAADVFPRLEGEEFERLVGSIRDHGQRHPIIAWKGRIVDGRNRFLACERLKVTPWVEEREFADDADAARFVVDSNIHRRHLTESQRGMLTAKIEQIFQPEAEKRKKSGKKGDLGADLRQGRALAKAAKAVNVSESLARSAKYVTKYGCEELVELVEAGKVKVSAAKDVVEVLTLAEQRKLCKKGPKAITETAADLRQSKREERARKREAAQPKPKPDPEPEPQEFECDACGKDVPADATSCPHCGTVFEEEQPEKPSRKVIVGGSSCGRPTCKTKIDPDQCIEADGLRFCSLFCLVRYKMGHVEWKPARVNLINKRGDWEGFWESLGVPLFMLGTLQLRLQDLKKF